MGQPISLGNGSQAKLIDINYPDIIYMTTRIVDPSCVGVVELVVSQVDESNNLTSTQYGGGWTLLHLFTRPFPPDIAEGPENIPSSASDNSIA